MKLFKTFESFTTTGHYSSIEELDRDCMIVIVKGSTTAATIVPERFWKFDIIMKEDFDKMSKYYSQSNYKPSTLPYYTDEQIIKAMNDNIQRGNYTLNPKSDSVVAGTELTMPK